MVGETVDELVRRQADIGVDVVSDGEVSKPGFVNYIGKRLSGFGGVGAPWALGDMDDLPELVMEQYGGAAGRHILMPECVGPISYVGQDEVQQDIAHLRPAARGWAIARAGSLHSGNIARMRDDVRREQTLSILRGLPVGRRRCHGRG